MELLEASKDDLPEIYCDLDMVLVNFMKGADDAVGGDGFVANRDKDEKWGKINNTKNFWVNLEWMPGAKRLINSLHVMNLMFYLHILVKIPTPKMGN